jgi:TetR/AcrR family transcriptional repressor of bet genes
MGPIRREQICLAAAKVISEHGFAGTTMRMVADEAGVSTGMLNHYFANRMDMLEETLLFVSTRQQAREAAAIEGIAPGERRLRALIRAVLPTSRETMEAWRVWIAAHGASVRLPQLRRVMAIRNDLWYGILEQALEGIVPRNRRARIPYVLQFDALIYGLVIQAITTDAPYTVTDIERVLLERVLEHGRQVSEGAARNGRSRSRRVAAA